MQRMVADSEDGDQACFYDVIYLNLTWFVLNSIKQWEDIGSIALIFYFYFLLLYKYICI